MERAGEDQGRSLDKQTWVRPWLKAELLGLLGKGSDGAARMARVGDRSRLEDLVTALEVRAPFNFTNHQMGTLRVLVKP
jgi:hypothetical protein